MNASFISRLLALAGCGLLSTSAMAADVGATYEAYINAGIEAGMKQHWREAEANYLAAIPLEKRLGFIDPSINIGLARTAIQIGMYSNKPDSHRAKILALVLARRRALLGENNLITARTEVALATAMCHEGDCDAAKKLAIGAMNTEKQVLGYVEPDAYCGLADIYRNLGRDEDANELNKSGGKISNELSNRKYAEQQQAYADITKGCNCTEFKGRMLEEKANCYARTNQFAKANTIYRIMIDAADLGSIDWPNGISQIWVPNVQVREFYAQLLKREGQTSEAQRVLTVRPQFKPEEKWWHYFLSRARAHHCDGDAPSVAAAEEYYRAAVKQAEKFGRNDPRLNETLMDLAIFYEDSGQTNPAKAIYARLQKEK